MRVDLTVCDAAGMSADVAVISRTPTPLSAVAAAAPELVRLPFWIGSERLDAASLVGTTPLCHGAVLSARAQPSVAATGTVVRVVAGRDGGCWRPLGGVPLTAGRDPGCDLVLTDPDVSRRHLLLAPGEPLPTVVDLGSTNGTRLDGEPVGAVPIAVPAESRIQLGDTFLAVAQLPEPAAVQRPAANGTVHINRTPLLPGAAAAPAEIALPEAEATTAPGRVQWLAALLPALLGVALAVAMHSPQYLLFALTSPVLMLATGFGDRLHGRRHDRRAAAAQRTARADVLATIETRLTAERAAAAMRWPDPPAVARIAAVPTVRLWERSARDGLSLRIGLGPVMSKLQVRDTDGVRPAAELHHQPATLDLTAGALGVVAPGGRARRVARWLIGQLATLYSPADVELCVLADPVSAADWSWTRWLPHARGRVAVGRDAVGRLIDELRAELSRRPGGGGTDPPWRVLIIDLGAAAGEQAGLAALLRSGAAGRIGAICVAGTAAELPDGCTAVARVVGETGGRARLTSAGAPDREVVLDQVSGAWAETVARSLAPYVDADQPGGAGLPDRCRLPELHGLLRLDRASVGPLWARGDPGARAVIGLGADAPVELDLVRDGPHALVAGTTGAGKSELLQTWVAGLATEHPPSDLAFVLIDYKGGAAFGASARLPHVTALVTDLDAHLTRRALRSLRAELRRREQLFADAGVADLVAYRDTGPAEPLPRLVIVVDEFAALADELPAFVTGLVGIAQRGRSLGVHLILATQRPGGVVSPEIRANCALRICLRVLEPAESADVVGVEAAAGIDPAQPGRAYLARGRPVELVQVARAGAPAVTTPVQVVALDAWRRPVPGSETTDGPTDVDDLIAAATALVTEQGLPPPRRPWLAALPDAVSIDDLAESTECPLGLLDLPDEQRQAVETLDLATGGGLLFAGSARAGRTTALLTIAVGAARSRTANQLQLYGLDFAGGSLSWLRALPHTGTVVSDDPAGAAALLTALEDRVAQRLARLTAAGRGSVGETGDDYPALVLLLDGWEAFVRAGEDYDHGVSTERLAALIRAGSRVGLTVAVTGDRTACTPRLAALMRERYVLRFSDPADYATAGLPASVVPTRHPPGRAIRVGDGADLLIAHAGTEPGLAAGRAAIDALARRSAARAWSGPSDAGAEQPIRIRPLPDQVTLAGLSAPSGMVALGRGGADARALCLDPLAGAGRLLVAGPPRSGRSTVLRLVIAQRDQLSVPLVLAAPARSPARELAEAVGVPVITPDSTAAAVVDLLAGPLLLLVDDTEAFLDTAAGDALHAAARAAPGLAVIATGRSDELLVTYRGIVAEVRRARCALLLQPSATDLELVGERPTRVTALTRPGRGLLRADPAADPVFTGGAVPIQVALP